MDTLSVPSLIVGELQRDDAAFLASQPLAEPACIDNPNGERRARGLS